MKNNYATLTKWFKASAFVLLSLSAGQAFSQCFSATASHVNVSCNASCNGSASVKAQGGSGAFIYSWLPTGNTSSSVSNLCAATYTVYVVDAVNSTCFTSIAVTITEPAAITSSINKQNATCGQSNGSATIVSTGGTGAFTYSWSNNSNGSTVSGLSPATYTVTILDANACSASTNVVIQDNSPVISATVTNATCGANNGAISASSQTGTPAYTFTWSTGATTGGSPSGITGLSPGTYKITLTDGAGCTATTISVVQNVSGPTATTTVTPAQCGSATGSISANVTGGTPNYTYSWSNGGTTSSISNLQVGTYTLMVMDANGCMSMTTATVNCVTGINENENALFMTVSPNPSNGSFVLEGKFEKADRAVISLTNILGETVMLIDNVGQTGVYKKQVNIDHLSNGIYFLVVQQNNERLVKKIVTQ
jgi:hypothetical protein